MIENKAPLDIMRWFYIGLFVLAAGVGLVLLVDNESTSLQTVILNSGNATNFTETDPRFTAENSSLARIASCAEGYVVQNTTIGGVQW